MRCASFRCLARSSIYTQLHEVNGSIPRLCRSGGHLPAAPAGGGGVAAGPPQPLQQLAQQPGPTQPGTDPPRTCQVCATLLEESYTRYFKASGMGVAGYHRRTTR